MADSDQEAWEAKIEPEARPYLDEHAVQISIAISLKRIADELCGANTLQGERLGLIDALFETRNKA